MSFSRIDKLKREIMQSGLHTQASLKENIVKYKTQNDVMARDLALKGLYYHSIMAALRIYKVNKATTIHIWDLVQEGMVGAMVSLEKYDLERAGENVPITYLKYRIERHMRSHIYLYKCTVRRLIRSYNRKVFMALCAADNLYKFDVKYSDLIEQIKKDIYSGAKHKNLIIASTLAFIQNSDVRLDKLKHSLTSDGAPNTESTATANDMGVDHLTYEDDYRIDSDRIELIKTVRATARAFMKTHCNKRERYIFQACRLSNRGISRRVISNKLGISRQRVQQINSRLGDNFIQYLKGHNLDFLKDYTSYFIGESDDA